MEQNKQDYSTLYKETEQLKAEMADKDLALAVQTLLKDWLAAYQELIINRLKACPVTEMEPQRNLLVASEAFNDFLNAIITNGVIAEQELKTLLERHQFENQRGYYPV